MVSTLRGRAIIYCLLILLSFAVYSPANIRLPADDQIWYLAELDGSTSLRDGLALSDYSRQRKFFKGDEITYRPLLFSWLAVQNSLFGYQYRHWNIANLCLHILVVILLFELLRQIAPSFLAILFAMTFSITTGSVELILWHHLGGYLLGFALMLVSLKAARAITDQSEKIDRHNIIVVVCATAVGALFYELLIPVSLLIAGYIYWISHRRRQILGVYGLALFLPLIAYAAVYLPHLVQSPELNYVDGKGTHGLFNLENIINSGPRGAKNLIRWTGEFLFPVSVDYTVNPYRRLGKTVGLPDLSPLVLANLAIVTTGATVVTIGLAKYRKIKELQFATLLLAILCVYCLMISFGRSPMGAREVGYYGYLPSLILITILYSLINIAHHRSQYRITIGLLMSGFFILNLFLTHRVVDDIARANTASDIFFQQINTFINQKKSESGFSFNFTKHNRSDLDPVINLSIGYPNDPAAPSKKTRLSTILFSKYLNAENPSHLLDVSKFTTINNSP